MLFFETKSLDFVVVANMSSCGGDPAPISERGLHCQMIPMQQWHQGCWRPQTAGLRRYAEKTPGWACKKGCETTKEHTEKSDFLKLLSYWFSTATVTTWLVAVGVFICLVLFSAETRVPSHPWGCDVSGWSQITVPVWWFLNAIERQSVILIHSFSSVFSL